VPKLDNLVALVTGAARGMGAAEARALAYAGARVVLADVLVDEVAASAAAIGSSARSVALDVADEVAWQRVVDEIEAEEGRLDILVNNAGTRVGGRVDQMSTKDYLRVVEVNQLGTFLGMRSVAPLMAVGGGGSIVNTSSAMAGTRGRPGSIAYAATKWAIVGMTKSAALDLAAMNIRVNAVLPGVIDTPMAPAPTKASDPMAAVAASLPMGRLGSPDEVARLVVFLASEDSSYCTGSEFSADGGWGA
jgi:3alpha(or 20beta)-hydroxysteroid dehydrogenase